MKTDTFLSLVKRIKKKVTSNKDRLVKYSLAFLAWASLMTLPLQTGNQTLIIQEVVVDSQCQMTTEQVMKDLSRREGEGDTLTDIPTGKLGVTGSARKAVGASEDTPDTDVALGYLKLLESKWEGLSGYEEAPGRVKEALLDSSYNMGEQVLTFPEVVESLDAGDYLGVVTALLDTANVDNKSVKGLAKRRAELYNSVSERSITEVVQFSDGTIVYMSGHEIVYQYRPSGGKHERSKAGIINLDPDASILR